MPIINIGTNYEKVFKSICSLSDVSYVDVDGRNKRLLEGIVESASWDDKLIKQNIDGTEYSYYYDSRILDMEIDGEEAAEANLHLTNRGASWFKDLRGNTNNEKGSWQTLIDSVANMYHSKFAYIEYEDTNDRTTISDVKIESYKNKINEILNFFSFDKNFDIEIASTQDTIDILCVNLKLQIEEEKPVLGKVYFSEYRGNRVPLSADDAKELDSSIEMAVTNSGNTKTSSTRENIVENLNKVLRSLEELINPNSKYSFKDSILYSTPLDEKIIDNLLERNSMDGIRLVCKEVKVFSVTHVKWKIPTFDIKYNGRCYFKGTFNSNDLFSLSCSSCGNKLIDNSLCTIVDDENNEISVPLHINIEGFGLDNNSKEELITQIFSKHNKIISCNDLLRCRNIKCNRLRCESQSINDSGRLYCKNCPYPEVVSFAFNFEDNNLTYSKLATKKLNYASDLVKLTQNEITKCSCCGRNSSVSIHIGLKDYCPLCSEAFRGEKLNSIARKTYSQYKMMLPTFTRAFKIFSHKGCFEDNEIIVFRLGKNHYVYNKIYNEDNELRNYKKSQFVKKVRG